MGEGGKDKSSEMEGLRQSRARKRHLVTGDRGRRGRLTCGQSACL